MTREEAIHEIKQWDFINNDEMEALRTLIPELAESEDERMRKAALEGIEYLEREIGWDAIDDIDILDVKEYLEKQKEPKDPFDDEQFSRGYEAGKHDALRGQVDAFVTEYNKGFNAGRLEGLTAGYNKAMKEMGQQEQKPNIELIQRSWYMEGYNDRDFFMEPKWILKTGEGGPKYEPNPRYGKSLILGTKPCCCSVNVESEYDKGWRDGHKAGLKDAEMQKPAWSEEDEKDMAHIIRILDDCYAYGRHDLSKTDHENLVNKLKSIRPGWKPSEEQMEALKESLETYKGFEEYDAMKSLYNDLKKLGVKEEPEYYQHFDPDC